MAEEAKEREAVTVARSRAKRMARPPESATGDIDRVFDRIRTIAPPTKVDAAWEKSFGLADAEKILTWIGLVEGGNVVDNDLWNRVRLPASRREALSECVRRAYKPIFDQIDVEEASQQDIDGAFAHQYSLGDTRRYVRAFGAFLRHAGIPVPALEPRKARTAPAPAATDQPQKERTVRKQPPPAQEKKGRSGATGQGGSHSDSGVAITLNVEIPAEWTEDQIRERLASVKRALGESNA